VPLFDASDNADVDPFDVPKLPGLHDGHRQLLRLLHATAHRDAAGRLVSFWPGTEEQTGQQRLAVKLAVSVRTLQNWLADVREPGSDPRHPTARPPGLRLGLVKVEATTYRHKPTGRHRLGGNLYVLVESIGQHAMPVEPVRPAQVNTQASRAACLKQGTPASEERWVSTPTVSNPGGGYLFDVEDLEPDDPQRWIAPQYAGSVRW
jgi:hypothetical protein